MISFLGHNRKSKNLICCNRADGRHFHPENIQMHRFDIKALQQFSVFMFDPIPGSHDRKSKIKNLLSRGLFSSITL